MSLWGLLHTLQLERRSEEDFPRHQRKDEKKTGDRELGQGANGCRVTTPDRPVGNPREGKGYRGKAVFPKTTTPGTWSPASRGQACPGPGREHHKGLLSAKSEIPMEPENGNYLPSSHNAGKVGIRKSIAFSKYSGSKTDPCLQKADCQLER